jgi:hypothetical protein
MEEERAVHAAKLDADALALERAKQAFEQDKRHWERQVQQALNHT